MAVAPWVRQGLAKYSGQLIVENFGETYDCRSASPDH
jgi:hypothetical protein